MEMSREHMSKRGLELRQSACLRSAHSSNHQDIVALEDSMSECRLGRQDGALRKNIIQVLI